MSKDRYAPVIRGRKNTASDNISALVKEAARDKGPGKPGRPRTKTEPTGIYGFVLTERMNTRIDAAAAYRKWNRSVLLTCILDGEITLAEIEAEMARKRISAD
jgi:hypothetical protein